MNQVRRVIHLKICFHNLLMIAAGLSCVSSALGATVLLNSAAGLAADVNYNGIGSTTTVAVAPHPSWQVNNPVNPGDPADSSAVWISYAKTGYADSNFQPYQGITPVFSVIKGFASGAGLLNLKVWADDSADVYLDGSILKSAAFTQSICSGQPIGCLPSDAGIFSTALSAGNHELKFVVYQVGTGTDTVVNPMGLLFTGTAPTPAAVPEPSSLALLGGGILTLAFARYGRKR